VLKREGAGPAVRDLVGQIIVGAGGVGSLGLNRGVRYQLKKRGERASA